MTLYEKNLAEIGREKPYLFRKINENAALEHSNKPEEIEIIPTLDNDSTVAITVESKTYRLNSLYSPAHEAQRWAMQYNLLNIEIIVVMYGLGNGCFARELIKNLRSEDILIIYEPSADLFFHVLENYDLTDILGTPNVSVAVEGINDNEIINRLNSYVTWINMKSRIVCSHPHYDAIFPDSRKKFDKVLRDNRNLTVMNKNTEVALSGRLITNMLRNLEFIGRSNLVTELSGKFPEDVPAIIVSAGPSLDKNIEDLRLAKGKAVIFAVDTAMKYLLAHDIIPDFIVTLDTRKSLKHLRDPRCKQIPIMSRFDSRYENLAHNDKNIIFYNLEGYIKKLYRKANKYTGTLHSGGSVATGAFSICEAIGFQYIIFVGQDLAYQGEFTHAGGLKVDVTHAAAAIEIVEGNDGNPIKTRYDWYVYLKWFEDAIELFEGKEVINATEGGAKMKGATILTLKEAIDQYCTGKVNCEDIIAGLKPTFNDEELRLLSEHVKADLEHLAQIRMKAEEVLDICRRLINKYGRSAKESQSSSMKFVRISEINNYIEHTDVYKLIDWEINTTILDKLSNLYTYTEDEKQNKLSTYQQAEMIYKAIIEAVDKIQPLLSEGLQFFVKEA